MHDDDDVACMHDIGPGNGCNHRRERVIAYIITIHTLVTHTHSSIKGRKQREREREVIVFLREDVGWIGWHVLL